MMKKIFFHHKGREGRGMTRKEEDGGKERRTIFFAEEEK
jgi:hypothetical protein